MTAQVIDFDFSVAQALGFTVEDVRDAKPILHELGLRIGDVFKDIASDLAPTREALALAQAMSSAVVIQVASEALDQDEASFYERLIEAADRGLFDLDLSEASPRLTALYAQYLGDQDEN